MANMPASPGRQAPRLGLRVHRPDRLARAAEGRVCGIHLDLGQQGRTAASGGQTVGQFLLDQVADHAFGFRIQDIQRIGRIRLAGGALLRQQADLWPVAVRDHQFVLTGNRRHGRRGDLHVAALVLRRE